MTEDQELEKLQDDLESLAIEWEKKLSDPNLRKLVDLGVIKPSPIVLDLVRMRKDNRPTPVKNG